MDVPNKRKRKTKRRVLWILLGTAAVLAVIVVKTAYDAGEFKSIQPHFAGTTATIPGVIGGEDITIDHAAQLAYISADDRFGRASGHSDPLGAIYVLDLKESADPIRLDRTPENPIAPHGISLVKGTDGRNYLYVVDHFQPKIPDQSTSNSSGSLYHWSHRILLYAIEANNRLTLVQTFENPEAMISPNDVVGIDEGRFYFTNDHGSTSSWGRTAEEYLQLQKSNVVYFDGTEYRVVADQIGMANGINLSKDGSELYVAATIAQCIIIYDRNQQNGSLNERMRVNLGTGVDNIELDEAGNLWVGCHPKLLTFVRHSKDTSRLSPSQIYQLKRSDSGDFIPKEIFLDDGSSISGSAVGAVSGNILLIGPVLDNRLLRCQMIEP